MIPIQSLANDDTTVRTQITLTAKLKQLIEQSSGKQGQSLSEYLRRAALLKLYIEEDEKGRLRELARRVVGTVDLEKHPGWRTKEKVNAWAKNLRNQW